jgi:hypothetical protein
LNQSRLLTWSEIHSDDEASHVLLAPIAGKGEDSQELNQWLRRLQSAREAAERKRLFYVACTRAQEELHLFAAPGTSSATGNPQPAWNSLLKAAWPAAQRHFIPPAPAQVVTFKPAPIDEAYVGDLAAQHDGSRALIERLPLSFKPRERFETMPRFTSGDVTPSERTAAFTRPEGSMEARALGNVVHAFTEMLARRISHGTSPESLVGEVRGWDRRIANVLRGEGLPPVTIARLQPLVTAALENMLRDGDGLWILAAQEDAASEYGLTVWDDRPRSVRIDRIFRAGDEPRAEGRGYLWIIDYKTRQYGPHGVERFLEEEQKKYRQQMETYARMMQASSADIELRLGLYYPLLPKLVWWKLGN